MRATVFRLPEMSYQYDVFISYSRPDDMPLIPHDEDTRWVSVFRQILETSVGSKLGCGIRCFFDSTHLGGNDPLTPAIEAALASSAVFVAVGSNRYYHAQSTWCRLERQRFLDGLGSDPAASKRVFIVHQEKLPRESWQREFFADVLGYYFYDENARDGLAGTFGKPKLIPAAPDCSAYFDRMERLSRDIAGTLAALAGHRAEPPRATVFLAESSPDLDGERESLRSFLEQENYRIVPAGRLERAPVVFAEKTRAALAEAQLFVQLLGAYPSLPAPDLPHGYEGLQLECVGQTPVPVLQWRPPFVDPTRAPFRESFAGAAAVYGGDLEEFKQEVAQALHRLLALPRRQPADGAMIGIAAVESDIDNHCQSVGEQLRRRHWGFEWIPANASIVDAAAGDDYSALLVLNGCSSPEWVHARLRQCRQVMIKKKTRPPAVGIYFCKPPPDPKPLRMDISEFHHISWDQDSALDRFLHQIPVQRQVV